MSLLTIIQNTTDLLGIPRPQAVVASTDQQIRQLYALANEEGQDLASRFDWQILTKEWLFTTTATATQATAVAPDFDHFLQSTTNNRTTVRAVIGPITPQAWQSIQTLPSLATVYLAFRQRGNGYLVTPTPAAGQTVAYEYVSKNWATDSGGTVSKSAFSADTDVAIIPETLMQLGLRWRWRKTKGLPYAEDFSTYERQCQQVTSRDGGSAQINITGKDNWYDGGPNIPIGSFPGP